MTYDTKCYELALSFVEDLNREIAIPKDPHLVAHYLAQEIQRTIEDHLREYRAGR